MIRKYDLDKKVARDLGKTTVEVSAVTAAFLRSLLYAIVDEKEVRVQGFGRFRLLITEDPARAHLRKGTFKKGQSTGDNLIEVLYRARVWFKKGQAFRDAIQTIYGKAGEQGENMEKLGVDEGTDQEALEKKSNQGCPECGAKPEKHGNVLVCPVHGSEPFEEKK